MSKPTPEILVYITKHENQVLGGNPLILYIQDDAVINQCVTDIGRALKANVVQLKNGDYMIISDV